MSRLTDDDREMITIAGKAAGLDPVWTTSEWCRVWSLDSLEFVDWNPLTDDGDALRLAVVTGEPFVVRTRCVTTMGGLVENFDPAKVGDDLRATRRAIVRAAAEIGRTMA